MAKYEAKKFRSFEVELDGISKKAMEEHYKLYQGYVNKANEITEKLAALDKDPAKANPTYSDIRELKVEYTPAAGPGWPTTGTPATSSTTSGTSRTRSPSGTPASFWRWTSSSTLTTWTSAPGRRPTSTPSSATSTGRCRSRSPRTSCRTGCKFGRRTAAGGPGWAARSVCGRRRGGHEPPGAGLNVLGRRIV